MDNQVLYHVFRFVLFWDTARKHIGQLFPKKYFLFLLLGNHTWIHLNVRGSEKVSRNRSSNFPSIGVVKRQFKDKRFADSRLKKKTVFKKTYWNKTILYVCDSWVPIVYHESKSIPCVLLIPWFHVYTMSPCQYTESMSIPWVHKFQLYKSKNTSCRKNWFTNSRNKRIKFTEIHK